jgi:NitT/TauT family transport system substrate-binding protein
MDKINIEFTLFSAFYAPLIATMSGGFLRAEGLEPSWTVSKPGTSAIEAVRDGSAHVVQTALSQSFNPLTGGKDPGFVNFAQVNEMDGFFLTGRSPSPDFSWDQLEGSEVVLFGGGQPLVMFKYACHKAGIDYAKIKAIHVGGAADMDRAFREGTGDFIQQQGPFPQQLEADQAGHIVAAVGPKVGVCGFSSLASTRAWLETDMARAFTRAYIKTRAYMNDAPAAEIAAAQASFFPKIDPAVLEGCIATYQKLGNWSRHIDITPDAYEATLDIYQFAGGLETRFAYDQVCAPPPAV